MSFSILSESNPSDPLSCFASEAIAHHFSTYAHFNHFEVSSHSLKSCIGCFSCWLKTPGQCIFKDRISQISDHLVTDDVFIFVTPLQYGSYSAPIKNILDRSIPNVLPFFKLVRGEVHHMQRYKKKARQIIIAYHENLSAQEKETFTTLAQANSINFDIASPKIYFCQSTEDLSKAFTQINSELTKEGICHV